MDFSKIKSLEGLKVDILLKNDTRNIFTKLEPLILNNYKGPTQKMKNPHKITNFLIN